MQLPLRTLRYIVAAADAGSVTKAAQLLSVSQPAISGTIAETEAKLGTQLFIRHHARGIVLTSAGTRFVHEARLLLKHADDFNQSIERLGSGIAGEITIGCFLTLATRYMPRLLAEFARRLPDVTVRLEEGDQQETLDGLMSGRTELALGYAYALPGEIVGEKLVELPPYLLIPESHRFARRKSIGLHEMAAEPFILLDLPHSRDYFMNLFAISGVIPTIGYRSRSYELIRGLVGHGHGYTIHNALPGTSITYDGSRVAARAIAGTMPPVHMMLLRLRQHTMRPAVKAFANFLKEALTRDDAPAGRSVAGGVERVD